MSHRTVVLSVLVGLALAGCSSGGDDASDVGVAEGAQRSSRLVVCRAARPRLTLHTTSWETTVLSVETTERVEESSPMTIARSATVEIEFLTPDLAVAKEELRSNPMIWSEIGGLPVRGPWGERRGLARLGRWQRDPLRLHRTARAAGVRRDPVPPASVSSGLVHERDPRPCACAPGRAVRRSSREPGGRAGRRPRALRASRRVVPLSVDDGPRGLGNGGRRLRAFERSSAPRSFKPRPSLRRRRNQAFANGSFARTMGSRSKRGRPVNLQRAPRSELCSRHGS